jgi:hypothetical protein
LAESERARATFVNVRPGEVLEQLKLNCARLVARRCAPRYIQWRQLRFSGSGRVWPSDRRKRLEIQVRQTPVGNAGSAPPDARTRLASCVTVITAVAARVGKSRVTLQPGHDQRKTLVLRIDGKEYPLAARESIWEGGLVVRPARESRAPLKSLFPTGPDSLLRPTGGRLKNIWYMNVDVRNTRAREAIVGAITTGNWMPMLPDRTPLGPRPASLNDRHVVLNQKFADAWRVTKATSLFDYAQGTSTVTFTDRAWPPISRHASPPGSRLLRSSQSHSKRRRTFVGMSKNKTMKAQCIFDVSVTGEPGFARTYLKTQSVVP